MIAPCAPVIALCAPLIVFRALLVVLDAPVVVLDAPFIALNAPLAVLNAPLAVLDAPFIALCAPLIILDASLIALDAPLVALDAPLVALCAPLIALDAPLVVLDAPLVVLDAPVIALDAPLIALDAPLIALDAPLIVLDAPLIVLDAPLIALGRWPAPRCWEFGRPPAIVAGVASCSESMRTVRFDPSIVAVIGLALSCRSAGREPNEAAAPPVTTTHASGAESGTSQDTPLAAGDNHTCAVSAASLVFCWGLNFDGQLGVEGDASRSSPIQVAGVDHVRSLAAGSVHSCALSTDATVRCWGGDTPPLPGEPPSPRRGWVPERVPLPGPVDAIAAGGKHNCALLVDRSVWCWDRPVRYRYEPDASDPLSPGETSSPPPRALAPGALHRVAALPPARAVAVGTEHACALTMEGATYCWGAHRLGQLLSPTLPRDGVRLPTRIQGVPPFERLWAGGAHTCGRTPDAQLRCWGGLYTLHGLRSQWSTPGPVVSPLAVAVSLASVGAGESCALQENDEVRCWRVGQRISEAGINPRPFDAVDIPGLHEVVALAAGEKHGCARDRGGRVHCWGDREDEPYNGGEEERRRVVRLIPDF